ncbi:carbohydrate ABC transporter permease [Helcobacillus massiliensis]|uniref:Multiple sugar transport system permease protein n=1 Tax=Helcobacillus massiliensis TaxID=521392 RepID=A0A839QVW6_9MICO|nr:multiple sugar transport system permease protein [Helcobacillus massiliensis]MBB3023778.1 multiple sugar transport system permease protein [Helcobacillus massiliensis]
MAVKSRLFGAESRMAYLLLLPTLILLAVVVGFPLVLSIWQSFFRADDGVDPETGLLQQGDTFVGLQNYADAFTSSGAGAGFWNAFWNTTLFTVVGVSIETVLGVAMALIMARALRATGLIRASILIPWAIPTVVSALMWQLIFDANGIANRLLNYQVLWTTEGWQAKAAVLIADIWKTAPYIGLLTLAGLQTIDEQVYEAAKVDGAGRWRTFWSITLPLIRPVLVVAVLFRLLDAMRMFDLPYVLLGKLRSGQTLSMLAQDAATKTDYGMASAYSMVLFCYICLVAFLFIRLLGADVLGESSTRTKKKRAKGSKPKRLVTTSEGSMA